MMENCGHWVMEPMDRFAALLSTEPEHAPLSWFYCVCCFCPCPLTLFAFAVNGKYFDKMLEMPLQIWTKFSQ